MKDKRSRCRRSGANKKEAWRLSIQAMPLEELPHDAGRVDFLPRPCVTQAIDTNHADFGTSRAPVVAHGGSGPPGHPGPRPPCTSRGAPSLPERRERSPATPRLGQRHVHRKYSVGRPTRERSAQEPGDHCTARGIATRRPARWPRCGRRAGTRAMTSSVHRRRTRLHTLASRRVHTRAAT